jgi:hypothetical protein
MSFVSLDHLVCSLEAIHRFVLAVPRRDLAAGTLVVRRARRFTR